MALARLENLASREMAVSELRPVIGAGLGLVVHLAKEYDAEKRQYIRYMQEILAVKGFEDGHYILETLKRREGDGYTPLRAGMEIFQ